MVDILVKCSRCNGSGNRYPGSHPDDRGCSHCNGTGYERITKEAAEREILQDKIDKLRE